MKKNILVAITMLAMFGCGKELAGISDQVAPEKAINYREAVAQILKRSNANAGEFTGRKSEIPQIGTLHVDFASYEEAYRFFKSMEGGQAGQDASSSQLVPDSNAQLSTFSSEYLENVDQWIEGVVIYNYYAAPIITTSASNSYGLFTFGLKFDWNGKVNYSNLTRQMVLNTVSNTELVYSGLGTMQFVGSSLASLVKSDGNDKSTGKVNGLVQIEGSVVGSPISAFALLRGSYELIFPQQIGSTVKIKVLFSATMY